MVIIVGRVHPGETNSSWVLHGVLDYLVSREAQKLRDNLIFKIVPMINPDGVVAGNYRTSFIGKDLNRLYMPDDPSDPKYSKLDDLLKPETQAIQNLIANSKKETVKGILAFIDVHHHSQRLGSFMYGPDHPITNPKYQEVRVLPKLVSMITKDIFRYQSCRFKKQDYKENCARLYCEQQENIPYSYCLECSMQGFFTTVQVGGSVGNALSGTAR